MIGLRSQIIPWLICLFLLGACGDSAIINKPDDNDGTDNIPPSESPASCFSPSNSNGLLCSFNPSSSEITNNIEVAFYEEQDSCATLSYSGPDAPGLQAGSNRPWLLVYRKIPVGEQGGFLNVTIEIEEENDGSCTATVIETEWYHQSEGFSKDLPVQSGWVEIFEKRTVESAGSEFCAGEASRFILSGEFELEYQVGVVRGSFSTDLDESILCSG